MSASVQITLKNKSYTTPILDNDMNEKALEITTSKNIIKDLNEQLIDQAKILQNLNNQLMIMYINQVGKFP
jgi:uncharacterized coiled-coil protein SlyX